MLLDQEFYRGHSEGFGDFFDGRQGHVGLSTLDRPDEGAMQPGAFCELLLGEAHLATEPPNILPEQPVDLLAPHGASWWAFELYKSTD